MKKLKNIIGILLIVIITNVTFFNYVKDENKNLDEKAKTLNTSNVFFITIFTIFSPCFCIKFSSYYI